MSAAAESHFGTVDDQESGTPSSELLASSRFAAAFHGSRKMPALAEKLLAENFRARI
jgi:hypothetical protein